MPRSRPSAFGVLFCAFRICLLIAGGTAVYNFWQFARSDQCHNNLKAITLALRNYHDEYGCFPPAVTYGPDGKPWHSWRALILPHYHLDGIPQGYRFDEPWDSEHNQAFAREKAPHIYHCPADPDSDRAATSFLAVVGMHTMWIPQGTTSREDAEDGLSRTAHVIEVSGSGILWNEPRDLHFGEMPFDVNAKDGVGIRSGHGCGAQIALADGSVRFLSSEARPAIVRSLLLRDDGGPNEDW